MPKVLTPSPELKVVLALSRTELDKENIRALQDLSLRKIDWQRVCVISRHYATAALLYQNISSNPLLKERVPLDALSQLKNYYYACLVKNTKLWEEFIYIRKIFTREAIPLLPLKGIIFGEIIYHNPALRPVISDIDILIKEAQRKTAFNLLEENGYLALSGGRSHEKIFRKDKLLLELHWDFLPRWLNKIDTERLWSRAVIYKCRGQEINALSLEDTLLTLSLQIRHEWPYFKLFRICDINEIIAQNSNVLDWKYIWGSSRNYHLRNSLRLVLAFCVNLLGTPLPEDVSRILEGKNLRNKLFSGFIRDYVRSLENPGVTKSYPFKRWLVKALALDTVGDYIAMFTHKNHFFRIILRRYFRRNASQPALNSGKK